MGIGGPQLEGGAESAMTVGLRSVSKNSFLDIWTRTRSSCDMVREMQLELQNLCVDARMTCVHLFSFLRICRDGLAKGKA